MFSGKFVKVFPLIIAVCFFIPPVTASSPFSTTLTTIIPQACKDSCAPWVASIGPCVEKSGNMTLVYSPDTGNVDFDGNKIGLYFCLCQTSVVMTADPCLTCLSGHYCLTPAITGDNYKNVCNGNTDVESLVQSTSAGCV